nr:ATP-binding cassette domain-containing protein [Synergistales bacterium]
MIEVRDLKKSFAKKQALKGISFQIEQGEVFGLVGPDGAGKTTTLRIMAGVLEPSGGDVFLHGNNNGSSCSGELGYMPQNFSL